MTDTRKWNYHCTGAQLAFLRLFFLLPVDAVVDAITCWHFFFNRNRRAWSKNENAEICPSSRDVRSTDPEKEVKRSSASRAPIYNEYTELPVPSKSHIVHRAVLRLHVVRLSVCDVGESGSHRLEILKTNCTSFRPTPSLFVAQRPST